MRSTRSTLTCSLVATMAVTVTLASAAAAAPKKAPKKVPRQTQTLSFDYTASQSTHTAVGLGSGQLCVGDPAPAQLVSCFDIVPAAWAKYMTIAATDKSGKAAPMSLWGKSGQQVDANGAETFVCGTVRNAPVAKGDAWSISVDVVSAEPSCPGPATTGTITVTLSNLP
jgi:hypothetical protein